jgi:uncharacterized SAM-binding protein YcdF (DUF218 family)
MYHFAAQLLQPYTLLLLALAGVLVLAWRRQESRRATLLLTTILLGLLLLLSTPLAGFLALRSLEGRAVTAEIAPGQNDIIVVLSGSLQRDDDAGTHVRVGPDTFYRCYHAAGLYKRAGRCRLLLTGGKVDFSEPGPTLARAMKDFVIELGVQPDDVVLEEQSSTTYQNAAFSKKLLGNTNDARIFLVTDAAHMVRAEYCFQTLGVTVIPAPCNYRAPQLTLSVESLMPSVEGMDNVTYAAHEWLGLAWYRVCSLGK